MISSIGHKHFLLLEKNCFYALSWTISELGKLKDNGLSVIVIEEAILQTTRTNDKEALKKTYQLLGNAQRPADKQPTLQLLLDKAETICKTYFKEKNMESLIIGTAAV